jgi:hypothetical protein
MLTGWRRSLALALLDQAQSKANDTVPHISEPSSVVTFKDQTVV